MHAIRAVVAAALLVSPTAATLPLLSTPALHAQTGAAVDAAQLQALEYRMVGPHRGGRVTAVTGVPGRPYEFFMGSTGGGVWKTDDAGQTWRNVSDGYFEAGSMGALAVAPSQPDVIYAGTGSACIRGNVSTGIGMYKSADAGKTWTHVGLRDAGQIGRIRVHPSDADVVYAAVLGNAFGKSRTRGVYKSTDGGGTWENVLFLADSIGAVDLSMDAHDPDVLYAAMWRAERKPWTLISGAREGGIYKTTDGGSSWTRLTNGLPTGLIGKIGVSVSAADPSRVYAIVEAKPGTGVYRSDDAGASWTLINDDPKYPERPWYYNHIYADPKDPNTVYIAGEDFWKSTDGGKTFEAIDVPHGDNHDLWINPDDPRILIEANDGGANVSLNGGRSWSPQINQPTVEFYSVEVDDAFPYRIYGPQQDNSTISVPSRADGTGISIQHWLAVGGCETGPVEVKPGDPSVVYAGCYGGRLTRFDLDARQWRQIGAYPAMQLGTTVRDLAYRFQWNAPILASRHETGVLYHGSQVVHRSTDEGQSWTVVSPDLTRDDESKQGRAGEPITNDITGVEVYGSLLALEESPHAAGELWAASNDGLVHVTRDGGRSWRNVTPQDLPAFSTVNRIDLSRHRAGRAFIAAYRYRMNDWQPYIYRTEDYGRSWTRLTHGRNGIPANHPVRVVREDPEREGLLYAGTEFGLFVSFDDGRAWQPLQLNLPHSPVTDLAVHRGDLVVATQGRSFWVLDDLSPLRQLSARTMTAGAHLFRPRDAYRTGGDQPGPNAHLARDPVGGARLPVEWTGSNPPAGAILYYSFAEEPTGEVRLEILETDGDVVRSFTNGEPPARMAFAEEAGEEARPRDRLPAERGLNRFVWDLTYPGVRALDGDEEDGPAAVPGGYRVRLTANGATYEQPLRVLADPRIEATTADLQAQFDLLMSVRDRQQQVIEAVRTIRSVRDGLDATAQRLDGDDELRRELGRLSDRLRDEHEHVLVRPKGASRVAASPRLADELDWLASMAASADARPTAQVAARAAELEARVERQQAELTTVLEGELLEMNERLRARGLEPVLPR